MTANPEEHSQVPDHSGQQGEAMSAQEGAAGKVLPFPARDAEPDQDTTAEPVAGTALDRRVVDGDVVGDATGQPRSTGGVLARRPVVPPALAGHAKKAATAGGKTAAAGSAVLARHGAFTAVGMWDLSRRAMSRLTHGDLTAAIRQAKATGDLGMVAELEGRRRDSANARWQRIGMLLKALYHVPKFAAMATGSALGLLLLGSIFAEIIPGGADFASVWLGAADAVSGVYDTAAWLVRMLPYAAVAAAGLAVVAGWNAGRASESLPAWIAPEGAVKDVVPDEGAILNALRNLGVPALNRQFKEGWTPRWVQGTGRDGKGWRTQLELPLGVTVEMITDKKTVLAHNLVRLPVEVWPTEPKDKPGVLDLWVADQGILSGPVDPWPLLHDGPADYFTGVPVGIDQRGDEVTGKLMACNYGIAGTMGSGKTSLVIALLLGAMLDPLVEIDVFVMAYNVDYDPMKPRLRTLVKGDEDTQIVAAMDALRELRSEVTRRGQILDEMGGDETKLTRAIAEKDTRMRPRVVVFDECQELFRHEKYGEEAKQLAIKVMTKARKTGITLIFVTPAPSAESLPRDLAKTTSHAVCFAIGDHQGNDAILGTGAHKQGITATSLVPGEDIGTAMAKGFAKRPGLLRTHHIRKEKGIDEITPIVQRALALRDAADIAPDEVPAGEAEPERDTLADIHTALRGEQRVRTQTVLQRLTQLHPATYQDWTFSDLTAALGEHDIAPGKSGGVMVVRNGDITQTLTERDREARGDT